MIIWPDESARLSSNAPISIEGLFFGALVDGVKWKYTRLDGWLIGGAREINMVARPGTNGMFDGPSFDRERVITLDGIIQANSRAAAVLAARQLAAVAPGDTLGTITVNDPDLGVESAQVRLSAKQGDGTHQGVGHIRYQLQFTAPDHRKYGESVTVSTSLPEAAVGSGLAMPIGFPMDFGESGSAGTVAFTNTGTADTEPVMRVTGPLADGFEITRLETGDRLRYEAAVGTDLDIDNAAGTVSTEGQDRMSFLTVRDWFTVGAGEEATFRFSTLGTESAFDAVPPFLYLTASPAYH